MQGQRQNAQCTRRSESGDRFGTGRLDRGPGIPGAQARPRLLGPLYADQVHRPRVTRCTDQVRAGVRSVVPRAENAIVMRDSQRAFQRVSERPGSGVPPSAGIECRKEAPTSVWVAARKQARSREARSGEARSEGVGATTLRRLVEGQAWGNEARLATPGPGDEGTARARRSKRAESQRAES